MGDALVSMPWFYAWAGEVIARDLAPRVSDPDSWWEERHLARIRAWGSRWREQAERATQPRPARKRMPGA